MASALSPTAFGVHSPVKPPPPGIACSPRRRPSSGINFYLRNKEVLLEDEEHHRQPQHQPPASGSNGSMASVASVAAAVKQSPLHGPPDMERNGINWAANESVNCDASGDTSLPNRKPPPVKPPRRRLSASATSGLHSGKGTPTSPPGTMLTAALPLNNKGKPKEPLLYLYRRNSSFDSVDNSLSNSVSLNEIDINSRPSSSLASDSRMSSTEVSPKKSKHEPRRALSLKCSSTQTPKGWQPNGFIDRGNNGNSGFGKAFIVKVQEPFLTWEEQFARRLFMGRRCWSFMSRNGQKYVFNKKGSNEFKSDCGLRCECTQTSKSVLKEMKSLKYQNEHLQDQLKEVKDELAKLSISDEGQEKDQETVSHLMTSILKAQKEREEVMEERMVIATRERETAVKQLNDVVEILLQPNELLDRDDDDLGAGSESEEDERVYEIGLTEDRGVDGDDPDTLRERIGFLKMQLDHEIKLRMIQQKKSKRLEKVVNALHEKVALFHF